MISHSETAVGGTAYIPPGTPRNIYAVPDTNSGGQPGTLPGAFADSCHPPPVISSMLPDTAAAGWYYSGTVTGTSFLHGANARFRSEHNPDIPMAATVTSGATIDVGGNIPADSFTGFYDIVVVNPDGGMGFHYDGISIEPGE